MIKLFQKKNDEYPLSIEGLKMTEFMRTLFDLSEFGNEEIKKQSKTISENLPSYRTEVLTRVVLKNIVSKDSSNWHLEIGKVIQNFDELISGYFNHKE